MCQFNGHAAWEYVTRARSRLSPAPSNTTQTRWNHLPMEIS